jgi:hypothetical protein
MTYIVQKFEGTEFKDVSSRAQYGEAVEVAVPDSQTDPDGVYRIVKHGNVVMYFRAGRAHLADELIPLLLRKSSPLVGPTEMPETGPTETKPESKRPPKKQE